MASEEMKPPLGIFEGYMKKRKNIAALTLFNDCNKRYFFLDLGTFSMVYFKNRKKTSKIEQIPLREILAVVKNDDSTDQEIDGKEWVFQFYLITRSRPYDLRAYSWNDREVWVKALTRILDYKKLILAKRSISLDGLTIDLENIPEDRIYDLKPWDFGTGGKIKPLHLIGNEEVKNQESFPNNFNTQQHGEKIEDQKQPNNLEGEEDAESKQNQTANMNDTSQQILNEITENFEAVKINCDDGSNKTYSDTNSDAIRSHENSIGSDGEKKEAERSKFSKCRFSITTRCGQMPNSYL